MCGFVGILGHKSSSFLAQLHNATKSIRHRGSPKLAVDFYQSAHFCCGFTRLDICDLHTRSNQPFFKNNHDFVLCFNGEIYNYIELREELIGLGYKFSTTSDTEVVYLAYQHFKDKCFEKFRGMFAIAIFHIHTHELLLARDHFGIKPLYYTTRNNHLYFSSEIKAFKHFLKLKENRHNLIEFLSLGTILDGSTIFRDIYEIQPAQILKINLSDTSLSTSKSNFFHLIDTFSAPKIAPNIHHIESILLDSIALHTRADTDYGTQLSGGLDSSFITAIAHKHNPSLQAFSANFNVQALDESHFQTLLSKQLGIRRHSSSFDNALKINDLKHAIFYDDHPLHHPNILASNQINHLANKQGLKVLLSGDGADEFFCGYKWHLQHYAGAEEILLNIAYVSPALLQEVLLLPTKPIDKLLSQQIDSLNPADISCFVGQRIYLQKWLRRQDRSGMKHSVEIRVPFVDIHIATALNAISTSDKTSRLSSNKSILKSIAQNYLPHELIHQTKIGFPTPIKEYFASQVSEALISCLYTPQAKERGIYHYQNLEQIIKAHKDNKTDFSRLLWLVCNLELWLRTFVDD